MTEQPLTPRQADQKWVDDTRAEYLRRTEPKPVGKAKG